MSTYENIRTSASGFAFEEPRFLDVEGSDTIEYLHRMVTQNVRGMGPHEVRSACLCTHKGRMLGHLLIAKWEEKVVLITPGSHFEAVFNQLERYIIVDDVTLRDASDEWSLLSIQGPESEGALAKTFPNTELELTRNFESQIITVGEGAEILAFEHTRTGERGIDLLVPRSCEKQTIEALKAALGDIHNEHDAGFSRARIEAGIPAAITELTDAIIPVEAAMHHTISYTKGCYAGQEVIAKIKYLGEPPKTLLSMTAPVDGFPRDETVKLKHDGKAVGTVSSWLSVPEEHQVVFLAFVKTRMIPKLESVSLTAGEETIGTAAITTDPIQWGSGFELA